MKNCACMYLRLSREDGDSTESNSIGSQRQIIMSFAKNNEIEITHEFIDDGYSGSNFNRPDFKRMIKELENKSFNTIIVKDLSRFGRDYIESGKYLQKIFPEKKVRFISVNDNYDSENADVSDTHLILPIRNFINDSYCRDISMKVKSSKEMKRKNGEFISSFAPFGYQKDAKNKHKLVIDREVSHIVEKIFEMKIEGYSSKAIADFLNSIGIFTPGKYKENTLVSTNGFAVRNGKWDAKMINRIIENKVYIGTLEQGKTTKLNYKSTKMLDVSKSDWIVTEDAHEPIISKSNFYLANKMMIRDVSTRSNAPTLFAGMLYCKDCGSSMIRRKIKTVKGEEIFYICSEKNRGGDCTRHSIKESELIDVTSYVIENHVESYNQLLDKIENVDLEDIEMKIDFSSLEKEKKKYEKLRQSLYIDLEDELISSEEFERYRKSYLVKIKEIEQQIKNKKEVFESIKEKIGNKEKLTSLLTEDSLNRLSIVTFIDKILVQEDGSLDIILNNYEQVRLLENIIKNNTASSDVVERKSSIISFKQIFHRSVESECMGGVAVGQNL